MEKRYLFNVYNFCKSLCVINVGSPHGYILFYIYLIKCGWLEWFITANCRDLQITYCIVHHSQLPGLTGHILYITAGTYSSPTVQHTAANCRDLQFTYCIQLTGLTVHILYTTDGTYSSHTVQYTTANCRDLQFTYCIVHHSQLPGLTVHLLYSTPQPTDGTYSSPTVQYATANCLTPQPTAGTYL